MFIKWQYLLLQHYIITSFSSDKIDTGLRFRLPAMTLLEYIFSNVKVIVIRQSFILVSYHAHIPEESSTFCSTTKNLVLKQSWLYICASNLYINLDASHRPLLSDCTKRSKFADTWQTHQWFNSFENISDSTHLRISVLYINIYRHYVIIFEYSNNEQR